TRALEHEAPVSGAIYRRGDPVPGPAAKSEEVGAELDVLGQHCELPDLGGRKRGLDLEGRHALGSGPVDAEEPGREVRLGDDLLEEVPERNVESVHIAVKADDADLNF